MTECIICGVPRAEYLCSIKDLGVTLCEQHHESVFCEKELKLRPA